LQIKGEGRNDTKSTDGKIDARTEVQSESQQSLPFMRQAQGVLEEVQYVQIVFQGPCQLRQDSRRKEVELVDEKFIPDGF
jgi:hypothetical protein